jgi:unsaturated rhamnogalacturonyl hydrolase
MKSILTLLILLTLVNHQTYAQKTVVKLDYFYNNEYKTNTDGSNYRFHYIWEDTTLNGYSMWGEMFTNKGAKIKSLIDAPTIENLKKASVYIITDPDNQKESPNPNYMKAADVKVISDWVAQGGVLVLLANDSANADLSHFNLLANAFGIHFTDKVRNSVIKDITVGKIMVPDTHPIFTTAKQLYLKGICTLQLKSPAQAALENNGDVIMATSKFGKGTVFAVGDPWIYNEYVVNDRLNPTYQNKQAAIELTNWLLKQIPR